MVEDRSNAQARGLEYAEDVVLGSPGMVAFPICTVLVETHMADSAERSAG